MKWFCNQKHMSINLQCLCFISQWYGGSTIRREVPWRPNQRHPGTLHSPSLIINMSYNLLHHAASTDMLATVDLDNIITHSYLHCDCIIPLHLSYNASIYLPPPAVVWKVFSNWLNVSWAISSGHCQCFQFQCKRKTQDSDAYKLWQHHCSTLRLILNPLF